MESQGSAREAAAQLAEAEKMRSQLTSTLRLPGGFHLILGGAVAVMIASFGAFTGADDFAFGATTAGLGLVVFAAAAGYLMWRFRTVNGVWVGGLATYAIFGTTNTASVALAVPLVVSSWAAPAGLPWLVVLVSVLGGVAYAVCARRWWAAYLAAPSDQRFGVQKATLLLVLSVAGAVLLAVLALINR